MVAPGTASPTTLRVTGTATADGLRQAKELGFVSRLARYASGNANYSAVLGWRAGAAELLVSSDLLGLASTLPEPLKKEAQSRLPLRFQTVLLPPAAGTTAARDRLSVSLGGASQVIYERDLSGPLPRVLRGTVAIGADTLDALALPAQGVNANLHLQQFNADAWGDVLAHVTAVGAAPASAGDVAALAQSYLPTSLAVRAENLTFGARTFNHVVIGAHREGLLWLGNVDATELNG
ncbi:hypothetical protein GALL_553470 [mine drainage metagenome]|uniref:YhdP central domain-containing protein n=1 Tax=mine drainage metagenome TaxID=410659 RepID=A0A1J5PD07_9ZZZZ